MTTVHASSGIVKAWSISMFKYVYLKGPLLQLSVRWGIMRDIQRMDALSWYEVAQGTTICAKLFSAYLRGEEGCPVLLMQTRDLIRNRIKNKIDTSLRYFCTLFCT